MAKKAGTSGSLALEEAQYSFITIPAREQPEEFKLRVAAYARVSTASEDQLHSFAAQNRYYTELIAGKKNWKMVDIYADAGMSGTSAEKRADFQRLLADCRRGLIDHILVKSISRFARNTRQCLEIVRELKSIGVSVFFEEQNIDTGKMTGEFLTSLFAAMAQKESEVISANVRWSYRQRMQSGTFVPGSQPFGYCLVNGKITIVPHEAEIVRQIFASYLQGCNIVEIANFMKAVQDELPGAQGRKWSAQSVLQLLRNEKYSGDSLWQKTYNSDTFPSVKYRNRGEREKYFAKGTHPAIVSRDTFQRVQNLLERKKPQREGYLSEDNPFPKTIICGTCGAYLRRKDIRGVRCRQCITHDRSREECPLTPIREDEFQKAFLRLYYKLKYHGEPILKQTLRSLVQVRERQMLWSPTVVELNTQISFLSSQNQLLADMKKNGFVDPDVYISRSNELAEQLRTAKLQKERVLSADNDDTIPRTRELIEILDAGPEFLEAFDTELFGELVDCIIVENNERIRFRLKNGMELPERIERTTR